MLTFDDIKAAWKKMIKTRESDLKQVEPNFTSPENLYMKLIEEQPNMLTIQFLGFENAVEQSTYIPQAKRVILSWLKRISMNVQTMRGTPDTLLVRIRTETKFDESVKLTTPKKVVENIAPQTSPSSKYERMLRNGGLTHTIRIKEYGQE